MILFARLGALVMVVPGIGDRTVPVRIRLLLALALTVALYPALREKMPPLPNTPNDMFWIVFIEVVIGILIGFSVRLITTGLQAAGEIIAVQTGLAFAQSVDPAQGIQGTLVSNFLSVLAITLIFSADLHHLLLLSMKDSYQLFPVGREFPIGDFVQLSLTNLSAAFRIALQLSSPFLVFGLVFYLGIGILSRLIPQVQIFFVAMPANIFFGFVLFMVLLSTLMKVYLEYFQEAVKPFLMLS